VEIYKENPKDMNKTEFKCRICDHTELRLMRVKEMMYGMGDEFNYGECLQCHCLQILEIPSNLESFYPQNYYSYSSQRRKRPFKDWQRSIKRRLILHPPSHLRFLLALLKNSSTHFWIYQRMGIQKGASFLDVGAGSGSHIQELKSANLPAIGIDPFIKEDILVNGNIIVKKGSLKDMHNRFDVICFHHSFEHIPEQLETLKLAKAHLNHDGKILIRIPTTSSYAFAEYQEHWCQLDAPRHLYLHSHESIRILAQQAGLIVDDLWCDSSEMQFIASEQYRNGISLLDPKSYAVNKKRSGWSRDAIAAFKQRAVDANQALKGDQICVVLSNDCTPS
jgi:SAM-dependent methyltransferase